jgi:UDP-glucose 4-epimerase
MARILVTGGAGFIGSHVADACLEAGHDVVVVDNLSTGSRDHLNAQASFVELDIRSPELDVVFDRERPAVVMHLAAQIDVRRSLREPAFDADVNILGSINLLECCVRHRVSKIIYASTGGAVYGEPDILPASEDTPVRPVCHYGVSKYAVEQYARLYHFLYGLRYTVLRYPNVYGPRQNPHGEAGVCAILIGLMLEGKRPTLYGHGAPLRDYVYVGDIARANVLALTKGDRETLNLGSGKGTSVLEVFETLKQLIGFEKDPILEPLRPGEVDGIYTTGDRAAEILGWSPRMELREGLRRTLEQIKNQACSKRT